MKTTPKTGIPSKTGIPCCNQEFLKPYSYPKPQFKIGALVCLDGQIYSVTGGSHTHTQLVGVRYAVPNWLLKKSVKGRKKNPLTEQKKDLEYNPSEHKKEP